MPTYTYFCQNCNKSFEIFAYIKDYQENAICIYCDKKNTSRSIIDDVATQRSSVKKSDSELKTIGDLANRNRDRLSNDQKHERILRIIK